MCWCVRFDDIVIGWQNIVDAQTGILCDVPDVVYHGYSNNAIRTDTTMMHVDVINYYDT